MKKLVLFSLTLLMSVEAQEAGAAARAAEEATLLAQEAAEKENGAVVEQQQRREEEETRRAEELAMDGRSDGRPVSVAIGSNDRTGSSSGVDEKQPIVVSREDLQGASSFSDRSAAEEAGEFELGADSQLGQKKSNRLNQIRNSIRRVSFKSFSDSLRNLRVSLGVKSGNGRVAMRRAYNRVMNKASQLADLVDQMGASVRDFVNPPTVKYFKDVDAVYIYEPGAKRATIMTLEEFSAMKFANRFFKRFKTIKIGNISDEEQAQEIEQIKEFISNGLTPEEAQRVIYLRTLNYNNAVKRQLNALMDKVSVNKWIKKGGLNPQEAQQFVDLVSKMNSGGEIDPVTGKTLTEGELSLMNSFMDKIERHSMNDEALVETWTSKGLTREEAQRVIYLEAKITLGASIEDGNEGKALTDEESRELDELYGKVKVQDVP